MNGPSGEPVVSVVMANRDCGPYIGEAVRSVLGQTLAGLELILVDDASGDDSVRQARRAADGDPRLKVERLERSVGPGAARNRALALARGRWIAVVDSDDVIAPERLERLLAFAGARSADLVADNVMQFSEAGELGPLLSGGPWSGPREIRLAEFADANRLYGRGPSLGYLKPVIRRSALDRLGGAYAESLRIGEDYDLIARLLALGARYWIDPAPLYRYRRRTGSTSHRITQAELEALIVADDRFLAVFDQLARADLKALRRRRRSLQRGLAYDGLVTALKARKVARAVGCALADPTAAPLLLQPVANRLARLRGAT